MLRVKRRAIDDREFYPRVVLGDYCADQCWMLVKRGIADRHAIDVKAGHKILGINPGKMISPSQPQVASARLAKPSMATGHDWPENTEVAPGYSRLHGPRARSGGMGQSTWASSAPR